MYTLLFHLILIIMMKGKNNIFISFRTSFFLMGCMCLLRTAKLLQILGLDWTPLPFFPVPQGCLQGTCYFSCRYGILKRNLVCANAETVYCLALINHLYWTDVENCCISFEYFKYSASALGVCHGTSRHFLHNLELWP